MKDNLFHIVHPADYIAHPAVQLKELNRRADLGKLEEKLETLRNAIGNLDPDECSAALNRLCRGIDRVLGVVQRTHTKADRGFVRVLNEEEPGNGS